jgi:RNA polymerase sigma factor (sigma-70 family)
LESLCRTYWRPVYAFLRRKGYSPADAQDLTQEFFFRLIRQRSLASADPKRGRFRSFLLGALRHFLADEWDKARAAKRGGGQTLISWDAEAETTYLEKVPWGLSPDQVFAQQWAWTLVSTALERMSMDHAAEGKVHQFELLKPFLTEEPPAQGYDDLSAELGANRNTIAKTIQRLRQRFRLLVRQAALQTVSNPADLEDEVHQLFA